MQPNSLVHHMSYLEAIGSTMNIEGTQSQFPNPNIHEKEYS